MIKISKAKLLYHVNQNEDKVYISLIKCFKKIMREGIIQFYSTE